MLTLCGALAIAELCSELVVRDIKIKWPNDVYIGNQKCAGVLAEATMGAVPSGVCALGIGLNVNRMTWPTELREIATSLREQTASQQELDRNEVLANLLARVERNVDRLVSEGAAPIVRESEVRLLWRGVRVQCDGVAGTLLGLNALGHVKIETPSGVRIVTSRTHLETA
jgi:BirA family biotin operon repressor/biotin-[acetyl-CoA-carboxylase] ligase